MRPWEALPMALASLSAHKLRSALTILGIVIGVAAVIALMSLGRGAQAAITQRIEAAGSNLVFVSPGAPQQGGVRGAPGTAATLTVEDARALADPRMVPAVAMVAPEVTLRLQVSYGGQNYNARIVGVTPEYLPVRNYKLAQGEFLAQNHVDGLSTVAVLGATVAETLFGPGGDAIGQTIRIAQQPFRVIGVLERRGGTAFGTQDDAVLVPLTTLTRRLAAQRTAQGVLNVNLITVQVSDSRLIDEAKAQIAAVLRDRHRITGEDDFTVTSQEDLVSAIADVTNVFVVFLGSIAGISLLVGGIGIMNIMLVSVTERTREIGIRKAIGAKKKDILTQFITESVMMSLLGALTGVFFGLLASYLVGRFYQQTIVSVQSIFIAVGFAVATGLFFGVYPAQRAAALKPIDALRYE
jgi:putative ABC transport system permease protein